MPRNIHFVGRRFLDGKLGRFSGEFMEEDFEDLMKELDGELPQGFVAWHIPVDEIEKGSKRIDKLKEYPLVVKPNPFFPKENAIANARTELLLAKRNQEAEKEFKAKRADWLYTAEEIRERANERLYELGKEWGEFEIDILVNKVGSSLRPPGVKRDDRLLTSELNHWIKHFEEDWDSVNSAADLKKRYNT